MEKDQKDLVGKSSDNESVRNMLSRQILQDRFLTSELSSFSREIKFGE